MSTVYAKSATISSQADFGSVSSSFASTGNILVSDQGKNETEHWKDAIDQILKFKSNPNSLDQDDVPCDAVYEAAIDFAVDHKCLGARAPSWIVPSGAGRIAFEWHVGNRKFLLEFIEEGIAEYIEICDGKIANRGVMRRNPRSRKLELEM